jgi:hypothetical protein
MEYPTENCFGRNHSAPAEYKYLTIIYHTGPIGLYHYLHKYAHDQFIGNYNGPHGAPFIPSGKNKIFGKDIFVVNQHKQGYDWYWWKSRDDAIEIYDMLEKRYKEDTVIAYHQIYKYYPLKGGWFCSETYQAKSRDDLIGYDRYMEIIKKDIKVYSENVEFLKSIGEGHKSLNYLLYGPPGTGKTTMIRTLATEMNYPICIVNGRTMSGDLSVVLNPQVVLGFKIVLFEDFDRYLENESGSNVIDMSQILNQLDGIETTSNSIRFFSANNADIVLSNKALTSRLSGKFKFDVPDDDGFTKKLDRLLTCKKIDEIDLEKKKKFISLVLTKKSVTLRPFTNYVIRYLFDEDYFDKMIENIDEL